MKNRSSAERVYDERELDRVFTYGLCGREGDSADEKLAKREPASLFAFLTALAVIFIIAALAPNNAVSAAVFTGLLIPTVLVFLLSGRRGKASGRRVRGVKLHVIRCGEGREISHSA